MARRTGKLGAQVRRVAVGHANPDFDAYAAMIAATKLHPGAKAVFLGSQNANVRAFHNLHEDLLPFVDLRRLDPDAIEHVIMVDTRDPGRIGELGSVVARPGVRVTVYDHHPPAAGDVETSDDHSAPVGATTSILVHAIRDQGISLTPLEASIMLLGIHEDTGSLTYLNTTAYDADAVAFLMAHGADLEVVNEYLSHTLTPEQRSLLDALLESLQVWDIHGQHVAVGTARSDVYVDSASVLTHQICEDLGYRIAVAVIEMGDRIHVVGRSRLPEVDIGAVLARIGGGGHPQAASAALRGRSTSDVLASLRAALASVVPPPLSASDIMSSPVRVATIGMTMREAGDIMARWGHGGLPVVDAGRIVGLVTRKDVDKALRHGLAHAPVTGFMARDPITIGGDVSLDELQRLLARSGIGRVPIVEDGRLVGIVTRKDLLRAEHGDAYLDRATERGHLAASTTFLRAFERLIPPDVRETVRALGGFAAELGVRAHVVGGFVRDMLLGCPNLDVDVVIEGDGLAFAKAAAERFGWRVRTHHRFGTAVLIVRKDLHIDVTSARTEYYTRPGALPTVERSSLRQDLLRRDFSINAMAASILPESFGAIADPFGGLADLERGVVRALHSLSFVEDPTRILRAARFEQRFGFVIDASTEALLRQAVEVGVLDEVSGARLREELLDIIDEACVARILERLSALGVLRTLVPEGVDERDVIADLGATNSAFEWLAPRFARAPRRRVVLVAAFVGRAERVAAERWLRRMRFGREYGEPTLAACERRGPLLTMLKDGRRMRDSRLYFALAGIPDEAVIYLWALGDDRVKERIERYIDVLSRIQPAVTGDDLVAAGLRPGPEFSAILAQARADRLDGRAVGREAELENLIRLARRANARPSS